MWRSVFVRTVFRSNLDKSKCLDTYMIHDVLRKARGGGVGPIGGYPNHVKSLKGLVFKETVEPCRWRSERRKFVIKPVD